MSLLALDHRATEIIRSWGDQHLPFWRFIAARGMYVLLLFVAVMLSFALSVDFSLLRSSLFGIAHYFVGIFAPPIVATYLVTLGLQFLFRRARPTAHLTRGYRLWKETPSFPSAHASVAAVVGTFLVLFFIYIPAFPFPIFLAVIAVALVLFIALSRIMVGVHWLSDVLTGLLLGTILAYVYSRILLHVIYI